MRISNDALNQIFLNARTYSGWLDRHVDPTLLEEAYDIAKMGPTSMNCCPLRIVFVTSHDAKERLKPALMPGNVDKTMQAPVTAIMACDTKFYEKMHGLWPHFDAAPMFAADSGLAEATAFRNSSLQAAYFIVALRSLGLDCGPMSGFNPQVVDAAFFPDGQYKTNFLCNIGYGDTASLFPRGNRLSFKEVATLV